MLSALIFQCKESTANSFLSGEGKELVKALDSIIQVTHKKINLSSAIAVYVVRP